MDRLIRQGQLFCLKRLIREVTTLVVVNPVRLTSLGEFGTPQFVAEKLIQAERRKVTFLFKCCFLVGIVCNCFKCGRKEI